MFTIKSTHEGKPVFIVCDEFLDFQEELQRRYDMLNSLFPAVANWNFFENLSLTVTPVNNHHLSFAQSIPVVRKCEKYYDVDMVFSILLRRPRDYKKATFGLKHTVKPFLHLDLIDIPEHRNCLNKLLEYAKNNYSSTIERIHYATPYIDPLLNEVSDNDVNDFIKSFCVETYSLRLHNVSEYLFLPHT